MLIAAGRLAAHERERRRLQILARTVDQLLATASRRLASPIQLMAGPANKRPPAVPAHHGSGLNDATSAPSSRTSTIRRNGLAEAQELGRQALSDGVDILDVVGIHMEARQRVPRRRFAIRRHRRAFVRP